VVVQLKGQNANFDKMTARYQRATKQGHETFVMQKCKTLFEY